MFTYLMIFLSLAVILVVFFRRVFLTLIRKPVIKDANSSTDEEELLADARKLSRDEKSSLQKLYERSLVLIKKNDPKGAVKTLVQALAIDPSYIDAQKELGRLYLDQKMWGKASAVYKYLSERTQDPVDYSHLGLALYNNGELEESVLAYQSAISLDPQRSQRYISLGRVYADLNKFPLALIAFKKALDLDKDNIDYLLLVADVHMKMRLFDDTREILKKVIKLAPMGKIARNMMKELEEMERTVEDGK